MEQSHGLGATEETNKVEHLGTDHDLLIDHIYHLHHISVVVAWWCAGTCEAVQTQPKKQHARPFRPSRL